MHFCTKGSNVSPLKDRVMQLCSILIHYAAVIPIMITVMQADDLTLSCLWGPHLLTKKQLALSFCLQAYLTYTSIVALYWTLESQKSKKQEPLVSSPKSSFCINICRAPAHIVLCTWQKSGLGFFHQSQESAEYLESPGQRNSTDAASTGFIS